MKLQELTRDVSCSQCNSINFVFDEVYGFYTCNNCGHVWGYSEDDPDYDEVDDDLDCGENSN